MQEKFERNSSLKRDNKCKNGKKLVTNVLNIFDNEKQNSSLFSSGSGVTWLKKKFPKTLILAFDAKIEQPPESSNFFAHLSALCYVVITQLHTTIR